MTGRGVAARAKTPTRRRLGREERRAAIVAGAAAAFTRGGYSETSMADIAASAGVSHLIIYRHFESKERLYETVLQRAIDELTLALSADDAIGPYGPTPGALLAAARADRAAFEVLWRHAAREREFSGWAERARAQLLGAATTALAPEVAHSSLQWAARATVAYLLEAVLVWIEDGDPRSDGRFVAATDAAMRAGVRSWARSE